MISGILSNPDPKSYIAKIAFLIGSSTAVGGPIFVSANWNTMIFLKGIVRKLTVVFTGSTFAKSNSTGKNDTMTYTFSSRGKRGGNGKGMRVQPVFLRFK
jgi:hypothetical protein